MKKGFVTKALSILIILSVGVSISYPVSTEAKTIEEIQQEIAAKQAELAKLNEQMALVNKDLEANKAKQGGYYSEISKVRNIIAGYESQLALLDLQSKQVEEQINLATLQKEETEKLQDVQMVESYINWKTAQGNMKIQSDIIKQAVYYESYQNTTQGQILGLADQISKLNEDKLAFEGQKVELNKTIDQYAVQKALLEEQVAQYNNAVALANKSMSSMRASAKGITQSIDGLTKEQNDLMNQDNEITGGGTGGTDTILTGEFYFAGTGRDLYQGHGVGMSQWGAYGEAKNHGWTAEQILKLYYTSVNIQTLDPYNISVSGYGTMDIENYVAGLGEIPDKACGTADQILQWSQYSDNMQWPANDARRSKYVIDNTNTVWDCWPAETIKAQVIAARSYGRTSGQPICTSAACQVYKGGTGKAWAAWETKGKYITYNGQIIRAFYSSENNQGYGTANNDTVFSGYDGIGWPSAYLRAVNDSAVAGSYQYTNWAWRTNGYTLTQINDMFNYAIAHYNVNGSAGRYLSGIKQKVGTITGLTLVKDPSRRVRYVTLTGTSGSGNIQGLLFKYIWNFWVDDTHSADKKDYIYSITFSFQQK